MTRACLAGILLCGFLAQAHAGEAPRNACDAVMRSVGGPCPDGVPATVALKPGVPPEVHRNVGGFRVGTDDFAAARKRFGNAARWGSGDAGNAETKVCYFARSGGRQVTVVLAQNTEMSTRIDEVRLIGGNVDFEARCRKLDVAPDSLRTTSGIRPGMTAAELTALLGPPTHADDGLRFYYWSETRELKAGDPDYPSCLSGGRSVASRDSAIVARVVDGVLAWVSISRASAYIC